MHKSISNVSPYTLFNLIYANKINSERAQNTNDIQKSIIYLRWRREQNKKFTALWRIEPFSVSCEGAVMLCAHRGELHKIVEFENMEV